MSLPPTLSKVATCESLGWSRIAWNSSCQRPLRSASVALSKLPPRCSRVNCRKDSGSAGLAGTAFFVDEQPHAEVARMAETDRASRGLGEDDAEGPGGTAAAVVAEFAACPRLNCIGSKQRLPMRFSSRKSTDTTAGKSVRRCNSVPACLAPALILSILLPASRSGAATPGKDCAWRIPQARQRRSQPSR